MKRTILAAAIALACGSASAIQICSTTTRGPICQERASCPGDQVYVAATKQCIPRVACYPYGIDQNTGLCNVPKIEDHPTNAPDIVCELRVQWMDSDPHGAAMVFLTDRCDKSVDLAVHRIQGLLLGDK